ncbi:MAG: hydratase, partial [SAR324 cluster bacterium]|nr:hydratase [SAR324 cluster bacterium]
MTPEETQKAATLIWEKWDADKLLDELPEDCRPQTELEAHAIQSVFPWVSGQPQAGWKIAATSKAGQQHIKVEG